MTASCVSSAWVVADVRRVLTQDGAMLYDASRASNATAALFDVDAWRAAGALAATSAGRGAAYFIAADGREWVLRHYRRGGWIAHLTPDRYVWTGEAKTRPFREWRLLRDLYDAGLPVPAPVAAQYRRSGLTYCGDLITERIAHAQPLSSLLQQAPLPAAIWQRVGACIRRFHDAGACHADLNAHNVLLDDDGRVFVVDFDRGSRRAPGSWRIANLARLKRSLLKVCRGLPADRLDSRSWSAIAAGYDDTEVTRRAGLRGA
jgi:3-deoxy-D-manno-octulosonic acid kinase